MPFEPHDSSGHRPISFAFERVRTHVRGCIVKQANTSQCVRRPGRRVGFGELNARQEVHLIKRNMGTILVLDLPSFCDWQVDIYNVTFFLPCAYRWEQLIIASAVLYGIQTILTSFHLVGNGAF